MKQLTRAIPKQIEFTDPSDQTLANDTERRESYRIGYESSFVQTGAYVQDAKDVVDFSLEHGIYRKIKKADALIKQLRVAGHDITDNCGVDLNFFSDD
ncbi:hypothetical protein Tco_0434930 [Tanacetum coccineum]